MDERWQNEEERSGVVIQGLLILQGAIIFKVTGQDCNNVPIATIIFNDYYYYCREMRLEHVLLKHSPH